VHALAEVVVGQPDDGAGQHVRVLAERRLDLGRVDVGAAGEDQVGAAVASCLTGTALLTVGRGAPPRVPCVALRPGSL
jgi:hypothetical protein